MSMKLKDATPGTIVVMVDHIVSKQVVREIWYERLSDDVTDRRVRTTDGAIRYPENVPIRRVRALQYEIHGTDVDLRWDTGFDTTSGPWECDGRISVHPLDQVTRFPL